MSKKRKEETRKIVEELPRLMIVFSKAEGREYFDYALTDPNFVDLLVIAKYYGLDRDPTFKKLLDLIQMSSELKTIMNIDDENIRIAAHLPKERIDDLMELIAKALKIKESEI